MYEFKDTIATEQDFRKIMGEPSSKVTAKTLNRLDKHCRAFIASCPFVLVASSDGQGHFDVSPKGDPPGFVEILDDETLVIPERLGNRRADTFGNVLKNPGIGLIFLVPGKKETLRISGQATIVRDADIMARMVVKEKAPDFGLAIRVTEAFFHCSKCIVRSKLWSPEAWPAIDGLPSLAQTMVDGGRLDVSVPEMQEIIDNDEKQRLY
jgi:hypothetical protein